MLVVSMMTSICLRFEEILAKNSWQFARFSGHRIGQAQETGTELQPGLARCVQIHLETHPARLLTKFMTPLCCVNWSFPRPSGRACP